MGWRRQDAAKAAGCGITSIWCHLAALRRRGFQSSSHAGLDNQKLVAKLITGGDHHVMKTAGTVFDESEHRSTKA